MNDMVWYGGRGRLRAALQLFAEDAEAPETSDKFNRGREPAGRVVESGTDCHTSAAALVRNDETQAGAAGARNDEAQAGAAGEAEILRCAQNDKPGERRLRAQVRGELAGSLARYRGVLAQAAELERALPGFSLDDELNDPQFAGLLAADVPVRTAFEVVHHRQLQEAAFALAARRAAQSVASILALNERRPKENAVAPSAAAVVEDDPRQLTRKERRALRERVRKGEKVIW